jgi:DNA-binding NarL/FixJ family response regulator
MTIRVLVADDQSMVRAGFRMLLSREQEIEVVAEAHNGLEAVAAAARFKPTVILMDIRMPELDGLQATRRILAADDTARILILTTFDFDQYVYEALRAGASGFLLKDDPPEQLLAAIRIVAGGDALLSPAVTKRVIRQFARIRPSSPPREVGELTERELDVFRLVARGYSNAEISRELYISDTTVKTHITHILQKLELRHRVGFRNSVRARRAASAGRSIASPFTNFGGCAWPGHSSIWRSAVWFSWSCCCAGRSVRRNLRSFCSGMSWRSCAGSRGGHRFDR